MNYHFKKVRSQSLQEQESWDPAEAMPSDLLGQNVLEPLLFRDKPAPSLAVYTCSVCVKYSEK